MRTIAETQAEREVVQFLTSQPPPEEIIDFRYSPAVADRFYELVDLDRDGQSTDEERQELDAYLATEHIIRLVKAEVHRRSHPESA